MKTSTITVFAVISVLCFERIIAICPTVYGEQPCLFTPAPPGKTPSCARPGFTYCEHPSNYPGQLIEYLIKKWVYDHSTLLMDETQEEFSTYYIRPSTDNKYGYNAFQGGHHHGGGGGGGGGGPYPNSIQHDSYYPEPIHIPKPTYPGGFQTPTPGANSYIPPHQQAYNASSGGFQGYPDRRQPLPGHYEQLQQQQQHPYPGGVVPTNAGEHQVPYYNNDLWNSYIRNEGKHLNYTPHQRRRRNILNNMRRYRNLQHVVANNETHPLSRHKRQSDITGEALCQIRSSYIMPRAAVNVKGNWMYVVNMPQMSDQYTQLVKSETCVSQACSGLCSLPNGYTSRCEQKYVQKRLVALQEGGSQLYTDVFWFPSCCLCTITNSN